MSSFFTWPAGFQRIPDEDWVVKPVESLALKYDVLKNHGWYSNLDRTLVQIQNYVRDGFILADYSAGTGILEDRLCQVLPEKSFGVIMVDSSVKFLRLALEKFRREERLAFRLISYRRDQKRLQWIEETLGPVLAQRRIEGIISTNAIHLYYDLVETLRSWTWVLKPGAQAFIQSGNIGNSQTPVVSNHKGLDHNEWIIDETVGAIWEKAIEIVREDSRYAAYRTILEDSRRMEAYKLLREKYFLPVKPLEYYMRALQEAGFTILSTSYATIKARVSEWYDFLSVYHEGVLGWVGGVEKIEGQAPVQEQVQDRLALIRQAMDRLFQGKETFDTRWTYIICGVPSGLRPRRVVPHGGITPPF